MTQRGATVTALTALITWALWFTAVQAGDRWDLVFDNLAMAATMVVGSMVAGATSEGGGAVAFPVLTLLFEAQPAVARDFALMIQSVGMTAAALTIFAARIPIAGRAVALSWLGGIPGILIGVHVVSPALPPAATKLAFVSLWLAFGLALGWTLRQGGPTLSQLPAITPARAGMLLGCGLLGGVISGVSGSGIDIVTFSLLTLAFGVDERVATPTSVVLMAGNALVGFALRLGLGAPPISAEAWGYWWAAVPVVVVGAPMGARLIAGRSRGFVVHLLQASIAIQFIGALTLIPMTPGRIAVAIGTFCGGIALFAAMRRSGAQVLEGAVESEDEAGALIVEPTS